MDIHHRCSVFIFVFVIAVTIVISITQTSYADVPGGNPYRNIHYVTLKAVGNRIITTSGKQYIPEGISVYGGLEDNNYKQNTLNNDAQIEAAAKYWHVNTIRLQVAESNLFKHPSQGKTYNVAFLQAIINQVILARSLNTVVVINDQTEFTSRAAGPTRMTANFWRVMAKTFGKDPDVTFDLFNEPRIVNLSDYLNQSSPNPLYHLFDKHPYLDLKNYRTRLSKTTVWSVWKYGGQINNHRYIGMQSLVNQIRSSGVSNLIWIEGPYMARLLPPNKYLLNGTNIVYSIHHPDINKPSSWNDIASLARIKPVVDGEWAQYESLWPECYSEAYTNAPRYIRYLHSHNVGILAWSLQGGSLLQESTYRQPTNTNVLGDPTQINAFKTPNSMTANYSCKAPSGEGVGQLLMTYFAKNSPDSSPFTVSQ